MKISPNISIIQKEAHAACHPIIIIAIQTLQSSLFHRPALRNNNQCHRSGVSAAASHADQNPFCRSTGKNRFCADYCCAKQVYEKDCFVGFVVFDEFL